MTASSLDPPYDLRQHLLLAAVHHESAPAAAKASTMPQPMPHEAPVTIATRPVKSKAMPPPRGRSGASVIEFTARAREQFVTGDLHAAFLDAMTRVGDFDVPQQVPTLVISGHDDVSTPPAVVEALADGIPGSRLVSVPGGHLVAFTDPDVVVTEIRAFLDSLATRSPS